jgi:hypothetical protein
VISVRMCWRCAVIGRLRRAISLVAQIGLADWSIMAIVLTSCCGTRRVVTLAVMMIVRGILQVLM